jgi:uncharacterized protein YaaQ
MQNFRSPQEIQTQGQRKSSRPGMERQPSSPVQRLMAAVIQLQDMKKTVDILDQMGLTVIRLASTGAFLGRRNVTLLIGMPVDQVEAALEVIRVNCHQRVEYVSTPLEGAPMPIPIATPINVGGATTFTLEVDRFEEF